MPNYRFLYFYILFVLVVNIFVGMYDNSMSQDTSLEVNTESWFTTAFSSIGFLFKVALFGVFSPSIPLFISLIIWIPASVLMIMAIYELVVLLIP